MEPDSSRNATTQQALLLNKIKRENFLRTRRWDKLRTFLPIAYLFPAYLVARLVMTSRIGDPNWAIDRFRESSRTLLAAKSKEKNRSIRTLYARMAELNDIGIDQIQTRTDSRRLQKECLELKRDAVSKKSDASAEQFSQSANKLYSVREHLVDTIKKKIDKQKEVIEAIGDLEVLSKKDMAQLALAQAIDSVMSTRILTSAMLGDISGKYTAKQVQKSMMSPKSLQRTIRLTELCQDRYREWKSEF